MDSQTVHRFVFGVGRFKDRCDVIAETKTWLKVVPTEMWRHWDLDKFGIVWI